MLHITLETMYLDNSFCKYSIEKSEHAQNILLRGSIVRLNHRLRFKLYTQSACWGGIFSQLAMTASEVCVTVVDQYCGKTLRYLRYTKSTVCVAVFGLSSTLT